MAIRKDFTDFMVVDEMGMIEYFYVPLPDYYDFRPEELIGTMPQQQYSNLYDEDSTLMNAVRHGKTTKDYPQELVTLEGKRIRQISDTYCIRNGSDVIGAVEFAYYDKRYAENAGKKSFASGQCRRLQMDDMIGSSPVMQELRRKFSKVTDLESPVLLAGETGTGKEMAARIIHNASRRSGREFVYVNCGALPENLLEGILFGVKRGSFTDAEEKEGLFKIADKGTLFLDEINAMPTATQGKILRAIEEKRIRPLGGENEIAVDVRIIASCNVDLDDILQDHGMRKDLYFRLAVIRFEMPPLRKRGNDIQELAEYFIRKLNESPSGRNIRGLDSRAEAFFRKYDWPGNVRELKNTIEGTYFATEGDLIRFEDMKERFVRQNAGRDEDLSAAEDFFASGQSLKEYMDTQMKEYIKASLREHDGVLRDAAQALGLTTQMLRYNMQKYDISV